MKTAPFKRFVQAFLFIGERLPEIRTRLLNYGFHCEEDDLLPILEQIRGILPDQLAEKFDSSRPFLLSDDIERQWLEQFKVDEFIDFYMNRKNPGDRPEYFKWFNDCLWILGQPDTACIVNSLIFNGDKPDVISDVISFKYKKKIGVEALARYGSIFWDTSSLNARDALYFFKPFRDNNLIIRHIKAGYEIEAEAWDRSGNDGSDVPVIFHEPSYIKWKIGYKNIEVPSAETFLEQVKKDSYFKYYEAMNMVRSIEEQHSEGFNEKVGQYTENHVKRRNLEEQKARAAKAWLEMYIKAQKHITRPNGGSDEDEDVFEKMSKLEMKWDEEKIAEAQEIPGLLNDIRGDL